MKNKNYNDSFGRIIREKDHVNKKLEELQYNEEMKVILRNTDIKYLEEEKVKFNMCRRKKGEIKIMSPWISVMVVFLGFLSLYKDKGIKGIVYLIVFTAGATMIMLYGSNSLKVDAEERIIDRIIYLIDKRIEELKNKQETSAYRTSYLRRE